MMNEASGLARTVASEMSRVAGHMLMDRHGRRYLATAEGFQETAARRVFPIRAVDAGADGNLPPATSLLWVSAPAFASSLADVVELTGGSDAA
jgi:hypothetical protein